MKVSIQNLDKIAESSSSSGHKHDDLDEALEKICKPPCLDNRVWRGKDLFMHHCQKRI